jgi:hypothetical protein
LKRHGVSPIFTAMNRLLLIALSTLLLTFPALAQTNSSVGVLVGTAELLDGGIDPDFSLNVREVWYAKDLDFGTSFKIKVGKVDFDGEDFFGGPGPVADVDIEYALGLVEYRFNEIWGSTSLFAGPGAYRRSGGGGSESDFGFSLGVGGHFPMTRRLGAVVEAAYHWINFDDSVDFLTLGAGVRFAF